MVYLVVYLVVYSLSEDKTSSTHRKHKMKVDGVLVIAPYVCMVFNVSGQ